MRYRLPGLTYKFNTAIPRSQSLTYIKSMIFGQKFDDFDFEKM